MATANRSREYELTFSEGGYELQLRLLNSRDLAEADDCGNPQQARALLVERCLVAARHEGEAIPGAELPERVVTRLADRLAECDPLSQVLFDLSCPACAHGWQAVLDIATFFWMELAACARRLLHEVHTLARAYGWREADILNMSPWRRRCYLEMMGA